MALDLVWTVQHNIVTYDLATAPECGGNAIRSYVRPIPKREINHVPDDGLSFPLNRLGSIRKGRPEGSAKTPIILVCCCLMCRLKTLRHRFLPLGRLFGRRCWSHRISNSREGPDYKVRFCFSDTYRMHGTSLRR